MPRNSAGTYTLPAGNPVITDTPIESDGWANPTLSDIASELTNSLDRAGRGGMTGPFSITDGTLASPGLRWTTDTNNGLYRFAADDWFAVAGGVAVMEFTPTLVSVPDTIDFQMLSATPATAASVVRKDYVDAAVGSFLPLAGGSMTGNIVFADDAEGVGYSGGTIVFDDVGSAAHIYDVGSGLALAWFSNGAGPRMVLSTLGALTLAAGLVATTGTFSGNISAVDGAFSGDVTVGDDLTVTGDFIGAAVGGTTGTFSGALSAASAAITGALTVGGNITIAGASIVQNSQSAAYTLVAADANKHIFHPSADTTARIWTIPANSSVAFTIGTAVTFVNQNGAGVITISITTDTMRLAGAGTTGSRTLAANGVATALKVTSTEWIISGTGLT